MRLFTVVVNDLSMKEDNPGLINSIKEDNYMCETYILCDLTHNSSYM